MKIVKKGNVYKKAGWLKEHKSELCIFGCIVLCYAIIIIAFMLWG